MSSTVRLVGFACLTSDVLGRVLVQSGYQVAEEPHSRADIVLAPISHSTIDTPPAVDDDWVALLQSATPALTQAAKQAGAKWFAYEEQGLSSLLGVIDAAGQKVDKASSSELTSHRSRDPLAKLSARQVTVLTLLTQGASNADIAKRLSISPHTARTHVQNVLGKLGVKNRLAAAAVGRSSGLDKVKRR